MFVFSNRINKKIPRGPPSPPAPVMHSPSRKVGVWFLPTINPNIDIHWLCLHSESTETCLEETLLRTSQLTSKHSCFFPSFFIDDSERTAGVEDSTLYFQLEERKGNADPSSIIQLFIVGLKY